MRQSQTRKNAASDRGQCKDLPVTGRSHLGGCTSTRESGVAREGPRGHTAARGRGSGCQRRGAAFLRSSASAVQQWRGPCCDCPGWHHCAGAPGELACRVGWPRPACAGSGAVICIVCQDCYPEGLRSERTQSSKSPMAARCPPGRHLEADPVHAASLWGP